MCSPITTIIYLDRTWGSKIVVLMFIKPITKTYRNTGQSYTEHRFCVSYRNEGGQTRHKNLLTIRGLTLPKSQWKLLADTVEAFINQERVLYVDNEIENLAKLYSEMILAKHPELKKGKSISSLCKSRVTDEDAVEEPIEDKRKNSDNEKYEVGDVRSFGSEYIGFSFYKMLGFDKLFKNLGLSAYQQKCACLSIIGRLVNPCSENSLHYWAQNNSAIGELIEEDLSKLGKNALYRISDVIFKHKDAIESFLWSEERTIFNLKESLWLYDLTNTFLEGNAKSISKAKFGRSKEKRKDCRLLTLGMVVDENGFCKKSKVLEGSVSEPATLKDMIDSLSENQNNKDKSTVVMDAGIATDENLKYIRNQGYHYLCVSRSKPKMFPVFDDTSAIVVHESRDNRVVAHIVETEDEFFLHCQSLKMGYKERAMQDRYSEKYEEGLDKIIASLSKPRSDKKTSKIWERIGRLKNQYKSIQMFYHIEIIEKEGTVLNMEYRKINRDAEEEKFSGTYWLRTSQKDWNANQIWDNYIILNRIEAAFRSLKDELAFRPIYHQTGARAEAHIFIAVLAYHLLNAITYKLKQNSIRNNWKTVRIKMQKHVRATIKEKHKDGNVSITRVTSAPEKDQIEIYNALSLTSSPRIKSKSH